MSPRPVDKGQVRLGAGALVPANPSRFNKYRLGGIARRIKLSRNPGCACLIDGQIAAQTTVPRCRYRVVLLSLSGLSSCGVRPRDPELAVKNIGRRIGKIRKKKGWTQQEFADRAKVGVGYISKLEMGLNLTVHSIVKFSNVLQVPPGAFFESPNKRQVLLGRPRSPGRPPGT